MTRRWKEHFCLFLLVCVVVRALASEYTVIQLALTIMVSHACSPCMISFYEYSIEEKWLLCTHGPDSIFADSVSDSLQECNQTCATCLTSVSSMKMPSLLLQTFTPLNLSTVKSTELLSLIMSNANIYLRTKLIA